MQARLVHFEGMEKEVVECDELVVMSGRLVLTFGLGPTGQVFELLTDEGHVGLERVMKAMEGKLVRVAISRLDVDPELVEDRWNEAERAVDELRMEAEGKGISGWVIAEEPLAAQSAVVVDLLGVGPEIVQALQAVGILTVADVRSATDAELLAIPGIGEKTLANIREQVGQCIPLMILLDVGEEIAKALDAAGFPTIEDIKAAPKTHILAIPGIGEKTYQSIMRQIAAMEELEAW